MKNKLLLSIVFIILMSSFVSADFLNDVVGAWKVNATSGNQLIDSKGYADMIAINGNSSGVGKIGLSNNSFNHSGVYSYKLNMSVDDKPLFKTQNFSVVLNYFGNNLDNADFLVDTNWACPSGGASDGFQFDTTGTGEIRVVIGGTVQTFTGASAKLNASMWNNIVLTRSPSALEVYINGISISPKGAVGYNVPTGASCRITIGAYGRGDNTLNERTDEVMWLNKTLNSAEVLSIQRNMTQGIFWPYNSDSPPPPVIGNASYIVFSTGTTANNSVLVYPNAVISINTSAYNFGIIPTTNHSIYDSTGALLYRMTNISNYTLNNFGNLIPRVYYFNATANNLTFTNKTETRIVTVISNQSLVINAGSVVNNSALYYVGNNFSFNVTSLFFNNVTINITFNLYNSTGLVQSNSRIGNTSFNQSYGGLIVGTYYINASATDGVVSNNSLTRKFYVYDLTNNGINVPSDGQVVSNQFINFTWNATNSNPLEANISITLYNLSLRNSDSSLNRSIASTSNLFYYYDLYQQNLSIGVYKLRVQSIDSANHSTYQEKDFTLGTNALLNITLKNSLGVTLSNYTANFNYVNLGINNTQFTNSTTLNAHIIRNETLNITIDAQGYSYYNLMYIQYNASNSVTITLYDSSTLNITFKDQNTQNIIDFETIFIEATSEEYSYNFSTTTGKIIFSLARPDTYLLNVYSNSYANTFYELTVLNRTAYEFTMYLLNNTLDTAINLYVRNERNVGIHNADVIISKGTSTGYETINTKTTDLDGFVTFNLEQGVTYKLCIQATGYTTRCSLYEFYSANNPYNIQLSSTTSSTIYSDLFNDISYAYSPTSTILQNTSNTFILSAYSQGSLLEYISISTALSGVTTSSSSPTSLNIQVTDDLANYSNNNYPVEYCIKSSAYTAYCWNVTYFVGKTGLNTTNSLIDSAQDFKNELDTDSSGAVWYTLIAMFCILALCVIIFQVTGSGEISTIMGFLGLLVFGYLGWIDWIYTGAVVLIVTIIFFYSRSGGNY